MPIPLAFKKLVYDELFEADKRAREFIKSIPAKPTGYPLTKKQMAYLRQCCQACGVPWDENNPDCKTCYKRHEMRRYVIKKKAKNV